MDLEVLNSSRQLLDFLGMGARARGPNEPSFGGLTHLQHTYWRKRAPANSHKEFSHKHGWRGPGRSAGNPGKTDPVFGRNDGLREWAIGHDIASFRGVVSMNRFWGFLGHLWGWPFFSWGHANSDNSHSLRTLLLFVQDKVIKHVEDSAGQKETDDEFWEAASASMSFLELIDASDREFFMSELLD